MGPAKSVAEIFIRTETPRPRAAACLEFFTSAKHHKRRTANAKGRTLTTMLLTASEISTDQSVDSWLCLRAQPKRAHIAAACLRQTSEVDVCCPQVRVRKATSDGP